MRLPLLGDGTSSWPAPAARGERQDCGDPALAPAALRAGWAVAMTLAAAAAGVLLWLEMRRYDHFGAAAYDYGNFEQAVWLIAHGHRAFVTVRGMFKLADHFSPILYPVGGVRYFLDSPYFLFALQSLSLAAGSIPLYRLAFRHTRQPGLACLLVASYLAHPSLWGMADFDYHPETLAVPALLAAVDAIYGGKWGWMAFWCGLAMLCKETLPPVVFMLGLLAAWRGGRWRGAALAGGAAAWFALATHAMAYLAGRHSSAYWSLYGELFTAGRSGPVGLLGTAWRIAAAPKSIGYLVGLMGPLAFLPLLAPEVAVAAVPTVLSGVLSKVNQMHTVGFQYDVVPLAMFYAAAAVGMGRALSLSKREGIERFQVEVLLAGLLLYAGLASVMRTTWPAAARLYDSGVPAALAAERDGLLARIPPGASVTAPSDIVARLADRERIYMFPNPAQESCWGPSVEALEQQRQQGFKPYEPARFRWALGACGVRYVVLALDERQRFPLSLADYRQFAADALTCPQFGVVATAGDLVLLRRGAPFQEGLRQLGLDPWKSPEEVGREIEQNWDTLAKGEP